MTCCCSHRRSAASPVGLGAAHRGGGGAAPPAAAHARAAGARPHAPPRPGARQAETHRQGATCLFNPTQPNPPLCTPLGRSPSNAPTRYAVKQLLMLIIAIERLTRSPPCQQDDDDSGDSYMVSPTDSPKATGMNRSHSSPNIAKVILNFDY